jgi:hypothetical protein
MPPLGFKKQFAPKIIGGEKPFTVRHLRKDGRDPQAGQTLYMFTGMRTPQCHLFAEKPCKFAVTIKLAWCRIVIPGLPTLNWPHHLENFARLDGFQNYEQMAKFHKLKAGMTAQPMRLISWISRQELIDLLTHD